ncbi:hypothetical protein ACW0US_17645 [Xanthomonas euvesicatoria]
MRWPDLAADGAELVVEDDGSGRHLALTIRAAGPRIRARLRHLGFKPDGLGRYIRADLSVSWSSLRDIFPNATHREMPEAAILRDADPLRELRSAMRRNFGDSALAGDLAPAQPDAATAIRAGAMGALLDFDPVFFRNTGTDSRMSFDGVAFRRPGDRRIYINAESDLPITGLLGHEALHRLRADDPQLYQELVEKLRPLIKQDAFGRYALKMRRLSERDDAVVMSEDLIREEAVADIVGDMLMDRRVWARIDDRDLMTRLLEFLRTFLAKLAAALTAKGPMTQGTIGGAKLLADIETARDVVTDALVAWRDGRRPQEAVVHDLEVAFRKIEGEAPAAEEASFADSKIRNEDGSLRTVYRGEWGPLTDSPFDSTKLPSVPYSLSPDVASVYAMGMHNDFSPENVARVAAVHLNIKNPLVLGHPDEDVVELGLLTERLTLSGEVDADEVRAAFFAIRGFVRHWDREEEMATDDPQDFATASDLRPWDYASCYDVADTRELVELAKRAGYDGLQFTGTFTSADLFDRPLEVAQQAGYDDAMHAAPEFRAFYPEQVKSIYSAEFAPAFRRLWHGSPYTFDKPSLSYNLEGEGFNAQGYGLYLADRQVVGEHYKNMVTARTLPVRIERELVPGPMVAEAIANRYGPDGLIHFNTISSLLRSGYRASDVEDIVRGWDEPRRSLAGKLLSEVEFFTKQQLLNAQVLVCHQSGEEGMRAEYLGLSNVQREVTYHLRLGASIDQARQLAAADANDSVVRLLAERDKDQDLVASAAQGSDQERLQRSKERLRDTEWFLREAQSAARLLGDSGAYFYDVRGMVTEGRLYEAELSDDAMLFDWAKPAGSTCGTVLDSLSREEAESVLERLNGMLPTGVAPVERWGSDLYNALGEVLGSQQAASEHLSKLGYVGLRYPDAFSRGEFGEEIETYNYVVWDLSALHSFDVAFKRREASDKPFYSALLDAVEFGTDLPKRATSEHWSQWLDGAQRRGLFKSAERAWVGVDAWLGEQDGRIARTDLVEFVRENVVNIDEIVLGEMAELRQACEQREWTLVAHNNEIMILDDSYQEVDESRWPEDIIALTFRMRERGEGPTEYTALQLCGSPSDGGTPWGNGDDTYRELLIRKAPNDVGVLDKLRADFDRASQAVVEARSKGEEDPGLEAELANVRAMLARELQANGTFRGKHFHERPDILVHARFSERHTLSGEPVLAIEEIQSDWHQAGRKDGYQSKSDQLLAHEFEFDAGLLSKQAKQVGYSPESSEYFDLNMRSLAAERRAKELRGDRIIDAPFKRSEEWAMLAFRRLARWAAQSPRKYKHIVWTTGAQQVDRYSRELRQKVDLFDWVDQGPEKSVAGMKDRRVVFSCKVDREGVVTYCRHASVVGLPIEKIVGKDVATMITTQSNGRVAGEDLTVGGDGMKGFYDTILPAAVGRWAKQFGASIGQLVIDGRWDGDQSQSLVSLCGEEIDLMDSFEVFYERMGRGVAGQELPREVAYERVANGGEVLAGSKPATHLMHSVEITDALRASVLEGMPMFKRWRDNAEYGRDAHDNVTVKVASTAEPSPAPWDGALRDLRRRIGMDVEDEQEAPALKF